MTVASAPPEPMHEEFDESSRRAGFRLHGVEPAPFDDGYSIHAPVGRFEANAFGLHDMHGNVAEWVLDQHLTGFYAECSARGVVEAPLAEPTTEYPRVVRGGSWEDPAALLRSAARVGSDESWKDQDPQIPKSIWYHTDAIGVGFRVVRPCDPE